MTIHLAGAYALVQMLMISLKMFHPVCDEISWYAISAITWIPAGIILLFSLSIVIVIKFVESMDKIMGD